MRITEAKKSILYFFIGAIISGILIYFITPDPDPVTKVISVESSVDTSYYKAKLDSMRTSFMSRDIATANVNTDSLRSALWEQAKCFYKKKEPLTKSAPLKEYVATSDTTINNIKLKVEFISPIPIHPRSFFNISVKYFKETITTTVSKLEYIETPLYLESSFLYAVGSILLNLIFIWILL